MDTIREPSSKCLVLLPLDAEYIDLYMSEIVPAIEMVGLQSMRLDELPSAGLPLVSSIWQAIKNARVIIADLTGKNPNVFRSIYSSL